MKQFVTTTVFALATTPAVAHPGAHDHLTGWDSAGNHLLSSPFHQVLVAAAIGGLVLAVSLVRQARKNRKQLAAKPPAP